MSNVLSIDSARGNKLPSPLVYPLTDNDKLVEMLVDLLSESEAWVRKHLLEEELCLGKYHREEFEQWDAEPYVWSDGMERYYNNCRKFLFAMIVWSRRPHKLAMRAWIAEHLAEVGDGVHRILVIGDGLGFDSVHLSSCGYDVAYFELTELSIQFAKRLFTMTDSPPRLMVESAELKEESFDVVLCLDVLEHVPDPPSMVAELAGRLRPGGRLIVHAPFFFIDPSCPTHLKSNRRYSGGLRLYTKHGFQLVDGRQNWDPLVLVKASSAEAVGAVPFARWLKLRLGGLLLSVGRFWNVPHRWMANRARRKSDSRWLDGLSPIENSD